MRYVFSVAVLTLCVLSASSTYADKFSGTGSRWPAAQLKSIASAINSNYVYVGDGDTLSIFEKTDFQRVSFLRFKNTTEGVRALALYSSGQKTVIYAACGYSGVQIVDVTDPLNPTQNQTGQLDTKGNYTGAFYKSKNGINEGPTTYVRAYDIEIHNRYAYIADNTYGLRIIDLSTPLTPEEVGRYGLAIYNDTRYDHFPLSIDVYAEGPSDNVYAVAILNSSHGPKISRYRVDGFGTSNLSLTHKSWTLLKSFSGSVTMNILNLENNVSDRYAYCLDSYANDLMIYDVLHSTSANDEIEMIYTQRDSGNPLALIQPRSIDLRRVSGYGDYAYVTTYYPAKNNESGVVTKPGLRIIDMKDVENPAPVYKGIFEIQGANSVRVINDDVYVSSQNDGIYNLKTDLNAEEEKITLHKKGRTPLNVANITIANNEVVYLPDNHKGTDGGITILRVAPPSTEDDEDEDIKSVSIASPAFPVHEMFLPTPGQAKAICIKDSFYYGYIADGNKGIQFLDFTGKGLVAPQIVQGSNLSIAEPYEVTDVSVLGDILVALTTDPANELWAVDVSEGTSVNQPFDYSSRKTASDITGNASARKVVLYKGVEGTYAIIANGENGLVIINLVPDTDNPVLTLPPSAENLVQVSEIKDVRSIYASSDKTSGTGIYAYVADGRYGVHIVQLFNPDNLADINPQIIKTINTEQYGNAIDVSFFSGHLYVLTDNPDHAVLLYRINSVDDKPEPEFMSSSSSYGNAHSIWTGLITLPCPECISGFSYIKGVFIADGPGGISFKQVTDEPGTGDREWSDQKASCFISGTENNFKKTGLFPVFIFLGICLIFVCIFTIATRNTMLGFKTHGQKRTDKGRTT